MTAGEKMSGEAIDGSERCVCGEYKENQGWIPEKRCDEFKDKKHTAACKCTNCVAESEGKTCKEIADGTTTAP